jgi:hypothetical protein
MPDKTRTRDDDGTYHRPMGRVFTALMIFGALASCAHEVSSEPSAPARPSRTTASRTTAVSAPARPNTDRSERECANKFAPTVTTQNLTDVNGDLCAAFTEATEKLQPLHSITPSKLDVHVRLLHLNIRSDVRCSVAIELVAPTVAQSTVINGGARVTFPDGGDSTGAARDCIVAVIEDLLTKKVVAALPQPAPSVRKTSMFPYSP